MRFIFLPGMISTLLILAIFSACSTADNPGPHPPGIVAFTRELNMDASSDLTIREKKDGGFLIAGFSTGDGSINHYQAILTNTTSAGDILWTKNYKIDSFDYTMGGCAVETPDGKILMSGLSENVDQADQSYLFLAVIDPSGAWTDHSVYPVIGKVMYHEIIIHDDKYRLIYEHMTFDATGYATSDTLSIITLNMEGEVMSIRGYPSVYCTGHLRQLQDGSLLIPGLNSRDVNNRDSQLLLVYPNGDVGFRKSFGSDSWDYSYSAEQSHEGDYLLCGSQTYASISTLYRVNAMGHVEYQSYADSLHIEFNSLRKTEDGGYLFMNYYLNPDHYFSEGNTRLYFSKLNMELEVEWTSWLDDTFTRDINYHGGLPTELLPTDDGAFAFLFYNDPGGYLLVKTIPFN